MCRLIYDNIKGVNLYRDQSTLYIVSQNAHVSFLDNYGTVMPSFNPVYLSLGIDPVKIEELTFGENEKKLAKMYYYDTDNLAWVELAGNTSKNADTVTTSITKSGSYAIGIEINPEHDIFPPQITDYSPRDNESTGAYPLYWASLIEGPVETGIDLSKTSIIVDGKEVPATWNPVDNIISYQQIDSLAPGLHTLKVIASDYNGNKQEINSSFKVVLTTSIESVENDKIKFELSPNPAFEYVNISISSLSTGTLYIDAFNQNGQKIKTICSQSGFSGEMIATWDLSDHNGVKLRNGVYYVRITNNERIYVKKLIIY